MSETLGSLTDKLCICNLKLFAVQDKVHKAAQAGDGLDAEVVAQLTSLNLQRNLLMTELDEVFADGVQSGTVAVDPRIKIL